MQLPFLCEKSEVISLVLPGLMAGWLADKIVLNLEIFNPLRLKLFFKAANN